MCSVTLADRCSLCVFLFFSFSVADRGSRFLDRHAEGLQGLRQLLPEEMNAADGTTAHAQGLSFGRVFFLFFGSGFSVGEL